MRWIRELLLTGVAIAGGELRRVRQAIQKTAAAVMVMAMTCVLLLTAVGFFLASVFMAIASALGPTLSALLTGCGTLLLAAVVALVARQLARR